MPEPNKRNKVCRCSIGRSAVCRGFRNIAKDSGGAMFWLREAKDSAAIYDSIRAPYLVKLGGGAVAVKVKGREKSFVSTLPWREP